MADSQNSRAKYDVDFKVPLGPYAPLSPTSMHESDHTLPTGKKPNTAASTPEMLSTDPLLMGMLVESLPTPLPSRSPTRDSSSSTPSDAVIPLMASPVTDPGSSTQRSSRVSSVRSFASSPLNPSSPLLHSPFASGGLRGSSHITRIPSEESRALSAFSPLSVSNKRGSMILYRRADPLDEILMPPAFPKGNRGSMYSISGESFVSLSSDSKYPASMLAAERGLVAYAYDPLADEQDLTNDDDVPQGSSRNRKGEHLLSWRGLMNVSALIILVAGILSLFVIYPVFAFYHDDGRNARITQNTRINSTGQAVSLPFDPRSQTVMSQVLYVDPSSVDAARTRRTSDGVDFELVFSDEYGVDGRSFSPGEDQFWKAAGGSHPQHFSTKGGCLLWPNSLGVNSMESLVSFCPGPGLLEVGILVPGKDTVDRYYWSANGLIFDNHDLHDLPSSCSFMANEGFILELASNSTSPEIAPLGHLCVDYVRFYRQRGHVSHCDSHNLQRVHAVIHSHIDHGIS